MKPAEIRAAPMIVRVSGRYSAYSSCVRLKFTRVPGRPAFTVPMRDSIAQRSSLAAKAVMAGAEREKVTPAACITLGLLSRKRSLKRQRPKVAQDTAASEVV